MPHHHFIVANVCGGSTFGGRPLCECENAQIFIGQATQALARQFNLFETSYLPPLESASGGDDGEVRLCTPR